MEIELLQRFQRYAKELDGVFTAKDLEILLNEKEGASLYRTIRKLTEAGELIKVRRGLYATQEASLSTISARLYPESYVSTGTVLAEQAVIGSVPSRRIQAVKVGAPRIFETKLGTIAFLPIAKRLYFGFERRGDCYWATKEKAFLDVCYYTYKGNTFSFNIQSDVNRDMLDPSLIDEYLQNYDQRFRTYFTRMGFWQ